MTAPLWSMFLDREQAEYIMQYVTSILLYLKMRNTPFNMTFSVEEGEYQAPIFE
jgi:hypothetical protein